MPAPAPIAEEPVATNAEATNSAWAAVAHDQAEDEAARLAKADSQVVNLERAKEPWDDNAIDSYLQAGQTIDDLLKMHQGGTAPARLLRLADRWERISNGPAKRAISLQAQRKKREQVAQQQREQDAQRQLRPMCIQCCLTSSVAATRDHCEAACSGNVMSYLDPIFAGSCRTP